MRILVGIDHETYPAALDLLVALRFASAELKLVHVVESPFQDLTKVPFEPVREWLDAQEQEARRELEEAKRRLGESSYSIESLILHGDTPRALIEHGREWGAELVAIGSSKKGHWGALFYGSVTKAIAAGAELITTSYDGSPIAGQQTLFPEYDEGNGKRQKPKAIAVILNGVRDEDNNGFINIDDVEQFLKRNKAARIPLKGDPDKYPGGDFRSSECVEYLKQADIVVTNPPFSLFRKYLAQLVEYRKQFLIIANVNAITYKEVFPLFRNNRVWLGPSIRSGDREFRVPDDYPLSAAGWRVDDNGIKYIRVKGVRWFTNLDHGRRHEWLQLMTMEENRKYNRRVRKSPTCYQKYDNYDAIEVPFTEAIPSDYEGAMGVPITFLDKYNPEQFEILGCDYDVKEGRLPAMAAKSWAGKFDRGYIAGQRLYSRIFIRHRRPAREEK